MKRIRSQPPGDETQADQQEDQSEQTVSLSPESLTERSSAQTEVLKELLDPERPSYNLRYYGINE